jgi:hypothetical protein
VVIVVKMVHLVCLDSVAIAVSLVQVLVVLVATVGFLVIAERREAMIML